MDHSSSRPPDPASVFRLCSTVQGTWSHWCASALRSLSIPHPGHVGISLSFPPSAVRRWLSREAIPRLDRDLRLRLAAMASDLHGVRADVSSDNFLPSLLIQPPSLPPRCVCGGLIVGVTTSPPQAAPPAIGLGLPLAPSAMMWTVFSRTSPLLFPRPHHARAAWAHSCGVSQSDVPAFARHGWVFNPLDESNTPQTIRAHIRFVGLVCERLQPLFW